jgi:hypothetical protein
LQEVEPALGVAVAVVVVAVAVVCVAQLPQQVAVAVWKAL